jgi:hypothetical protein
MKTGVILYIAGDMQTDSDPEAAVKELKLNADRVEIVASSAGYFDVADAWWSLLARGMHRIVCEIAEFTGEGELRLTGRSLRLCG